MLALKGYEKTNGFTVMNTDELFFVNGGSNQFGPSSGGGNTVQSIIYSAVYSIVLNSCPVVNETTQEAAKNVAETISGLKK